MIPRNEAPAGSPPILSQKGYRQLVVYCVVGSWCDSSKYECFKHSQLQWICVPSLCETIQKTSGASNKNQCVFVSTHQRIHEQIRLESMTRPTSFDRRVRPLSIKGQYTPICTHNVSTQTLSYRTILIRIWKIFALSQKKRPCMVSKSKSFVQCWQKPWPHKKYLMIRYAGQDLEFQCRLVKIYPFPTPKRHKSKKTKRLESGVLEIWESGV